MISPDQAVISDEDREVLAAGEQYAELLRSPGYKRLRETLENWRDEALTDVSEKAQADAVIVKATVARWRERVALLDAIDEAADAAIQARKGWLEEYAAQQRLSRNNTRTFMEVMTEEINA